MQKLRSSRTLKKKHKIQKQNQAKKFKIERNHLKKNKRISKYKSIISGRKNTRDKNV